MDLIVDFPQQSDRRSSRVRSRSVAFAPQVEMKFVENLRSYPALKSDLWSSKQEMKSYKFKAALSVKQMNKSMADVAKGKKSREDVDTDDFVGLENYMSESSSRESKARKAANRRSVLMEQHRQDMAGICDPDAIGAVSEATSEPSRQRAQCIGIIHSETR